MVELVGEKREDVEDTLQLHRPAGARLENIGPGHQHIDLIYLAKPKGPTDIPHSFHEDKAGTAPKTGMRSTSTLKLRAGARGRCQRSASPANPRRDGAAGCP